jgi:ATP-binding cassette subfamily B protein
MTIKGVNIEIRYMSVYKDMGGMHMRRIIKLLGYVKVYRWTLIGVVLCTAFAMGESFFRPIIIQAITDEGMLRRNYEVIFGLSLLLVGLAILGQVLEIVQNKILLGMKKNILQKLTTESFDRLLHLKKEYFEERNGAEIINQLNTDIGCVGILLDQGFISMFLYCFRVITGIVGLLYLNWKMAICILACIPLKVILLQKISTKKEKMTTQSIDKNQKLHAWMSDRITGIQEIKVFNRYQKELQEFSKQNGEYLEYERRLDMLDTYNRSSESVIQSIMTVIFYMLGGYFVCKDKMSVGSVLAFITYSGNVTGPITILISIRLIIAQIKPSFKRLYEFWQIEPEKTEGDRLETFFEELCIENLCFGYGKRRVLKNISFTIYPGEKVALVGANGSGKSTLLQLMLGLYLPQKGEIYVNDQTISNLNIEEYRTLFSTVSQAPHLFQETVRENLDPYKRYTDKKILEYFSKFNMDDVYEHLPYGLDTVVGVSASNLSGGEKQKLALLRAVLENTPILILDECTSNYDRESEEWLFSEGLSLLRDRSVIFVTHQPQYLQYFDKVYALKAGKLEGYVI